MQLRKRIILSFTICISLIFSLLIIYVKGSVEKNNTTYTEEQTIKLVESKAGEVGQWLFNKISEFRVLSQLPSFKTMDLRGITPLMESLSKSYNSSSGSHSTEILGIGGLDGNSWVNNEETLALIDRDVFLDILSTDKEFLISEPEISPYNNKDMFMIYYPILNNRGDKIGLLYGGITTEKLINMLSEINSQNTITWVMNSEGEVFTQNENYFFNEVISKSTLSTMINNIDNKKSSTANVLNTSGDKSTVVYSHIPYTDGWLLCTIVDDKQIHNHTTTLIRNIVIFWIILLILAIILSYFLSSSLVKPLEELKSNMKEVEKGNMVLLPLNNENDDFYHFKTSYNNMLEKISNLIDTIYKEQSSKRKAELLALQSQINPHFLYNTLDTLKWIALDYDAFEISDIVSSLSSFFRISLSDGNEIITLFDEFEHSKNYLEIQKIRYSDILNYDINLDSSLKDAKTLKIIVQPLIENSLYHGIKNSTRNGIININGFLEDNFVVITVEDNGIGIPVDKLIEIKSNLENNIQSEHYGLYNINERLKLKYGSLASIIIESTYTEGTLITIKFPVNK